MLDRMMWPPLEGRRETANLTRFLAWLSERGLRFEDYTALHAWSVADKDAFWGAIWDYFDIIAEGNPEPITDGKALPGLRWFPNTRLNYAEHVLRHEFTGDPDRPMLSHGSELRDLQAVTWSAVGSAVRRVATALRELGIRSGDCVAAYMPNIPEAVIALLATTAIGATWAAVAPEFGPGTVIDRLGQIEPKMLFVVDGYRYGGRDFDRGNDLTEICAALPSLQTVVMLDYLGTGTGPETVVRRINWKDLVNRADVPPGAFSYERVASHHPLWILFSSGTTGLPKAIVHSHHGVVLEHYKSAAFHFEIKRDDTLFFYSTTGWMVWNTLMWGPLMNGTVILYDGHPAYPDAGKLFEIGGAGGATLMGLNPTFLQILRQQGIHPRQRADLDRLETVMLVGSPAVPEVFAWTREELGDDLWVSSQSGGTEFCSGLLAGSPLLPTLPGSIQAPALGVDALGFDDDGRSVKGQVGELVVRQPLPSMPIFLWGDEGDTRYRESYLAAFPGVWTHGDWVVFDADGNVQVLGRSDATLNRFGVRIGTAEIYRTIEGIDGIVDSLIVCIEEPGGGYYMPLFVQLAPDRQLDAAMATEIRARLKTERSPRHVPDQLHAVDAIPYTLTGKKMEVPVRKLLLGFAPEKVASRGSMKNPAALDFFIAFAQRRKLDREKKSLSRQA